MFVPLHGGLLIRRLSRNFKEKPLQLQLHRKKKHLPETRLVRRTPARNPHPPSGSSRGARILSGSHVARAIADYIWLLFSSWLFSYEFVRLNKQLYFLLSCYSCFVERDRGLPSRRGASRTTGARKHGRRTSVSTPRSDEAAGELASVAADLCRGTEISYNYPSKAP